MLRQIYISAFLTLALGAGYAAAQDVRYISDTQYIPVRSGAGNDYRIIHRGLPSGTKLTVLEMSEDGDWAHITTDGGTDGWLRAQYLMSEVPAAVRLEQTLANNAQLQSRRDELQANLTDLKGERSELSSEVSDTSAELARVSEELAQLKQISGKAVQLDTDNRRLTEETETLRAEVGTLDAENQRLQDKLQSSQFIDGALAVLLGVIITLVVPRLWPKRRRSSSWA